jgi:histidinol-phosphate aminotransferase
MDNYFKKSVLDLHGYVSPPQGLVRAKLNQNESPFDLPLEMKQEILQQAGALQWNRYPTNESPAVKAALANWHGVQQEQVLLGNGSNQLLQIMLSAVVEKGERVLYCPPTFGLFSLYATVYGGQAIEILHAPNAAFPLEKVLTALEQQKPKIILLCSPNNPTGSEIETSAIETICKAAPGLVFCDEAYAEFSERTALSLCERYQQLIISRTFSKAFSLAGLRLGYLISSAGVIEQLRKVNLPYNVNLFTEMVALKLISNRRFMEQQVAHLKKERDWLYQQMQALPGVCVYPSAANFILFRHHNAKKIFSQLKEQGILVRDVSGYPLLADHLRVTVGSHDENEMFLSALRRMA